MIVCGIELLDWDYTSSAEPARYNNKYFIYDDGIRKISVKLNSTKIVIYREYVADPIYRWAWRPYFFGDLSFLEDEWIKAYPAIHIKGTSLVAKNQVDNFLLNIGDK